MSLQQAFVGSLAIESAENYAVADVTSRRAIGDIDNCKYKQITFSVYADKSFWRWIGEDKEGTWGRTFGFDRACVSEWIARVPGLYWSPGANRMRKISPALVEMKTEKWDSLLPPGQDAEGGGRRRDPGLPPNDEGYRVVTLTMSANASAGVPALVAPEVWRYHRLGDGCLLQGTAPWRPMSIGWATRFPILRGLPRGYLVLDDPQAVRVIDRGRPY